MNKQTHSGKTKHKDNQKNMNEKGYGIAMKKRRRNGLQKEKVIMLTASLLVLSALTMTGVYVKEKSKSEQNDGYVVDFTELENKSKEQAAPQVEAPISETPMSDAVNDLDYDPIYREANSGTVQIPGVGVVESDVNKAITDTTTEKKEEDITEESKSETEDSDEEEAEETSAKVAGKNITFKENESLQWPVVGNVLLNYSMDKTIYFATLDQYKYNPSLVIEASKGEPIASAAEGEIVTVASNEEIGNYIVMNVGNGYEVTYGQLEKVTVEPGAVVDKGEILGYVADPSKYYSAEGCNVYFKLTKDGVPMNPMEKLQ